MAAIIARVGIGTASIAVGIGGVGVAAISTSAIIVATGGAFALGAAGYGLYKLVSTRKGLTMLSRQELSTTESDKIDEKHSVGILKSLHVSKKKR